MVLFFLAGGTVAAAEDEAGKDPVVATVDGSEIRMSEVVSAHQQLPAQYRGMPLQMIYEPLLNSMIDSKLAAAEARRQGLHEDDTVKREIARVTDQILERQVVRRHIEEGLTEEALRTRYEEHLGDASGASQIRARHILVDSEDEAKRLIEEINGGADFAELAIKHSTGPSGPKGGDLGFFSQEEMVPEFAEAAFALGDGEVTQEPVQTQFGWHVIKTEERRTSEPPSFEESQDTLRQEMSQELGDSYMEELRSQAEIERFNPDGSPR
jgi:peptidyl-prolyl cis-trans isomerase C